MLRHLLKHHELTNQLFQSLSASEVTLKMLLSMKVY